MFILFIKINILYLVCYFINLEYKFIEKIIFIKFIKEKSLLVIKLFIVKNMNICIILYFIYFLKC